MFYSRYLGGDKSSKGLGGARARATSPRARAASPRQGQGARAAATPRGGTRPSALVWHSGTGAGGGGRRGSASRKPVGYGKGGKRRNTVHFSNIEVQPFHFDWDLADQIFYTRAELTVMGQSRFDDAATLREQRDLDAEEGHARDPAELLELALGDDDLDENVSIRGIEHFVYPALQQEMIQRKKEVQKEVLEFVRSKRPNPQGWKLAEHSRKYSLWARNVALEKGLKYQMNSEATDPDLGISEGSASSDEVDKHGGDEMGGTAHSHETQQSAGADTGEG